MSRVMLRHHVLLACATVLALGTHAAFADTALQNGTPVTLPDLPASNYLSNLYIDVGTTARQLTVKIAGSGGDVDLFLRYGTPFPIQDANATYPTVSEDILNRYGHYHSTSSTSNESILVLPSSRIPLQAGRWYIDVINGGSSTATATLTATTSTATAAANIAVDFANPSTNSDPTLACDDSFWTDPTAATPIGGNNGTTLGQQRKNAVTYATTQLAQQLQIPVPITVHACGAHLGGDKNSAQLAHASPLTFFDDDPAFPLNMLPKKYTWYPGTVAVRLAGTSLCGLAGGPCNGVDQNGTPNNEEIEATFNMDFGTAAVLNGEKFYLGFDPAQKPANTVDFISIAMHEMTHGLGFLGLANTDPTLGPLGAMAGVDANAGTIAYQNLTDGPFDDIYDDNVAIVDAGAGTYTPFAGYEVNGSGDAARAAALVSGPTVNSPGQYIPGTYTGLRWFDAVAVNSSVNIHSGQTAPNNFPSLYAPCDKSATPTPATCATQSSSTLSHTVQAGDMMNAYYSDANLRSMGLAVPMLAPIGWSDAIATMPTFAQPIPSAWYDRSHSGHGFDFQLGFHDPIHGDVYILTFYTYTANGTPEWYEASGHLVDGVFAPDLDQNGNTLERVIYTTTASTIVSHVADPGIDGSVTVDFNQAANSPVCRNVDRSAATQLGLMHWSIGSDSGDWCVEPIVALSAHATPDYNGLWYAPSDSGWGFELLDVANSGSAPTINVLMYLPAADGKSTTWATGSGTLAGSTANLQLQQVTNGYCRTCTPPTALAGTPIGTMTLSFDTIKKGSAPTGKVTIQTSYAGGGGFNRNAIPIQMLSVPTGQ